MKTEWSKTAPTADEVSRRFVKCGRAAWWRREIDSGERGDILVDLRARGGVVMYPDGFPVNNATGYEWAPALMPEEVAAALQAERERAGEIALRELFGEDEWPDSVKRVAERMRAAILRGAE